MKCAARLPNDGSAAFPCAALVRAFAFLQRLPLELPTPPRRARCIECASIVPCLPSRSAGRSPFKVCPSAVDVCFAFLTDFPRGRGRRGRRSRPKPSAAARCQTSLPRICRARFPAFGGRHPHSLRGTMPRTIYRRTGARLASRGLRLRLRLFPRFALQSFPAKGDVFRTQPRTMTGRGAARAVVCGAALGSAKRSGDRSPHSDRYAARLRLGAYSPWIGVAAGSSTPPYQTMRRLAKASVAAVRQPVFRGTSPGCGGL